MTPTPDREERIAALRRAYDAFNRGDIDATVEVMDPLIEWTEPPDFPHGGTYHGHAGVKDYLARSRAAWMECRSEPERFIPVEDRIVVFVHARVRSRDTGECVEGRLADVYTFRNGKATHMRAFASREEALRWVGLVEP